jgi:hypothetical protein
MGKAWLVRISEVQFYGRVFEVIGLAGLEPNSLLPGFSRAVEALGFRGIVCPSVAFLPEGPAVRS